MLAAGWTVGIAVGILFSEWLIHRPLLNIVSHAPTSCTGPSGCDGRPIPYLPCRSNTAVQMVWSLRCTASAAATEGLSPHIQVLGFPIQLLGLLTLPYLGVRYYVDKTSKPADDFSSAAVRHLPACALPALLALQRPYGSKQ